MWSWTVPLAPLSKVKSSREVGCTPAEVLGRGSSFREPGQAARQWASKGWLHVCVNPTLDICDIYILLLVSFKPHGVAYGLMHTNKRWTVGRNGLPPLPQAVYPRPHVQRRDLWCGDCWGGCGLNNTSNNTYPYTNIWNDIKYICIHEPQMHETKSDDMKFQICHIMCTSAPKMSMLTQQYINCLCNLIHQPIKPHQSNVCLPMNVAWY